MISKMHLAERAGGEVEAAGSFILGGVEPSGETRYKKKKKVIESKEKRNNVTSARGP